MSSYALDETLYVHPAPAGAYFAVSSPDPDPSRRMIRALLNCQASPRLTIEGVKSWTDGVEEEHALRLLYHAQELGWVQGLQASIECNEQPLEIQLPRLLKTLTSQAGKALLADPQGFYLASSGFTHEVAEELSALSAELASLHARRSGLLIQNLGLGGSAWAIVDAAGNGKLGFWPMFIGNLRFVLVISGMPRFNHPDFVNLVWILSRRYSVLSD